MPETITPIKIGVSACLLGQKVRYNGGHQHDRLITEVLGRFMEFIPVCPEAECGLGIPRETMRLVGDLDNPRLLTSKTAVDHTDRMKDWAAKRLVELEREGLRGFIFKSRSPSSGMERVRVYGDDNKVRKNGVGLFARGFMQLWNNPEHALTLPSLFFNGTWVESGKRVAMSNCVRDTTSFVHLDDIASMVGYPIRLSTAVNMSSRFPYLCPPGTVSINGRKQHVVDGAYFENSGAMTAGEIIGLETYDAGRPTAGRLT